MKKYLLLPFISLLFVSFACANEIVWPQDASDLEPDPSVTFGQLENGVRWAFLPNTEPPGRLSLRLYVNAGSLMEREDQRGLAHFSEHMGFNGTEHFDADKMVKFFQRLGMSFGGDTNAHTSFKETVYKLELPNTTDEVMTPSFEMLRDYAVGMLMKTEEIEKERGVILSEINSRDSAQYRSMLDAYNFLLPHTIIPTRFTLGLKDVVTHFDPQVIRDFYKTWYTPDRLCVVGVGDCDLDTFKSYLEKEFGTIAKNENPLPDPDLGLVMPRGLEARVFVDDELSNVTVSIMNAFMDVQPDSVAQRIKGMKEQMAQAIVSRRLEKLSKKEGSGIIGGSMYEYLFLHKIHIAGIDVECSAENWRATVNVAEQELRKALQYGFSDSEFEEVKANYINAYKQAAASASTRLSKDLSSQIVNNTSNDLVFTSPQQELDTMLPVLEKMTKEDIHKALVDEWSYQSRLVYVEGNLPEEGVREADVMQEFLQSSQIAVDAPEETEVTEWAYSDFGKQGTVADSVYVEDLNIHQYKLSNNVFVNIKQTDFTADQVLVQVRFGAGKLSTNPAQEGYALALGSTFIQGGLEAHSWDDLQQILAGKTTQVAFNMGDDFFGFGGSSNAADFELEMQLLAAYFTHPGFRPEALRQLSKVLDPIYSQLGHDPFGVFQKDVFRFIGGDDYRFGYPEREIFDTLDYDAANAWLKDVLDNSRVEISIVGDIDPQSALSAVLKTFGTLSVRPEETPSYDEKRIVNFPIGVSKEFDYESELTKSISGVAFKTTDMMTDMNLSRRISTLASIYGDRMRVKIREEIGESYSPMAFNRGSNVYEDFGALYGLVLCTPDQAESIQEILKQIAVDLHDNGATEDELVRARRPIVNSIEQQLRKNVYWLNQVLSGSQENPKQFDWARTIGTYYQTITLDQINELAKEYLDTDSAAGFTIMPQAAEEK